MYFFDSYALVELINNSSSFNKFQGSPIVTSAINIAETHSVLLTLLSEDKATQAVEDMNVVLVEPDQKIAIAASLFRFHNKKMKLSYADCLGYCLARSKNLLFVTGDDAFNDMEVVEFIK